MTLGDPLFNWFSKGKLTVLNFHKVPVQKHPLTPHEVTLEEFEKTLSIVLRRFKVIPLDEAIHQLRAGNLPSRRACITFDDGYSGWVSHLLPVLERHGVLATFFITAGQLQGKVLWNERILNAVDQAPHDTLAFERPGLPAIRFGSIEEKRQSVSNLDQTLKYMPTSERESLISEIEQHTGINPSDAELLSEEDVRTIRAKGHGIGAHSINHPILCQCTPEEAYREIAGAKQQLECILGEEISAFAYPNGKSNQDFDASHIEMVQRAGYQYALTSDDGVASGQTPLFQIPRITPWGPTKVRMDLQLLRNLWKSPFLLEEQHYGERRALMIAFHFPPQSGSSGVLRTLNFVKNLPSLGWTSTLLGAHPRAFEEQSNDLIASVPPTTKIVRASAFDTARHFSFQGKYLSLFALPDRWASWIFPAIQKGKKIIRQDKPDLIWSTYPVASAHWIGAALAKWSGLPWVADFRDPMLTNNEHKKEDLRSGIWKRLESKVLENAAACIFTTQGAANTYSNRYPNQAHKCYVIENGFDDEIFNKAKPDRKGAPEEKLLFLHSGLIYPRDRDPSSFFAAVKALIERGELDPKRVLIRFRAAQHNEEVKSCAEQYQLLDLVELAPPVSYLDAVAEMMAADLLLVFQGSNFNTQVPAKIYEYVRAQRPVLAIVDPAGACAASLRQFAGVYIADISSVAHVIATLVQARDELHLAESNRSLDVNMAQVMLYSRRAQTEKLRDIFVEQTTNN